MGNVPLADLRHVSLEDLVKIIKEERSQACFSQSRRVVGKALIKREIWVGVETGVSGLREGGVSRLLRRQI